jgi:hypothetical protein
MPASEEPVQGAVFCAADVQLSKLPLDRFVGHLYVWSGVAVMRSGLSL